MGLTPTEVAALNERAHEVGNKIGWTLQFVVAPNTAYVALVAGPDNVVVVGPSKLADLAVHDIDLTLDALERGDQVLFPDEDGDPRLGTPVG